MSIQARVGARTTQWVARRGTHWLASRVLRRSARGGKRSISYTSVSLTPHRLTQDLQRTFRALRNGNTREVYTLASRLVEAASPAPQAFQKFKKLAAAALQKPEEDKTKKDKTVIKLTNSHTLEAADYLHEVHNSALSHNAAYRADYEAAVFASLAQTSAAEEMTDQTFVFRGVQLDQDCSEAKEHLQFASPELVFNNHTSGPVFPLGRSHHKGGGDILIPTIHDAHLASDEVRAQGRIGWSIGVVAQSLDVVVAANYSIAAQGLRGQGGRCNGYIYLLAPRRSITLAEHLYHGLLLSETRGAEKNYEIASGLSDPTTVICAWRVDQNGDLGPQIFNPNVDGAIKRLYTQTEGNHPALSALKYSPNVDVLGQLYLQSEDSSITAFDSQMAADRKAHAERVAVRLSAQTPIATQTSFRVDRGHQIQL